MNSGAFGEEWVARYLQKKGWEILERNYHSRYGEIDMIAVDGPYIGPSTAIMSISPYRLW